VQHVRRGLLGVERGALQVQGRLRHHLVLDPGVALLAQLDAKLGGLPRLAADAAEPLAHRISHLVADLEVSASDLDLHGRPP
jgi:hypothetical protein